MDNVHSVYRREGDAAEGIQIIHLFVHGRGIQKVDVHLLIVYQIVLPLIFAGAPIILQYLELLHGGGHSLRVCGVGSDVRRFGYFSFLVLDGVLPCHIPVAALGAGKGIGIVSVYDLVGVLAFHQSDGEIDGGLVVHLYGEALLLKGDVPVYRLHLDDAAHAAHDYLVAAGSVVYHIQVVLGMAVYEIAVFAVVLEVSGGRHVRPQFHAVKAQRLAGGIQELIPYLGLQFFLQSQLLAELAGHFIVLGVVLAVRTHIYGGSVLKLIGGAGLMVLRGQSGGGGLHLHIAYAQVVAVHIVPLHFVHLGLCAVIVLPVVIELCEVEAVFRGVFYTSGIGLDAYAAGGLYLIQLGGAYIRRPDNVLYPVHKVLVLGIHLNLRVDNVTQTGNGLYRKRGIAYPQLSIVIGISLPGNILSGTQEVFNDEYLVGIYLQVIQILYRAGLVSIPGRRVELSLVVGIAVIELVGVDAATVVNN